MLRSIYVRWECEPIGEGGAELPVVLGGGGDEAQEWREGDEVLTTLLLQMLFSKVTISGQQFHDKDGMEEEWNLKFQLKKLKFVALFCLKQQAF